MKRPDELLRVLEKKQVCDSLLAILPLVALLLLLGAVGLGVTLNGIEAKVSNRPDLGGAVVLASNSEIHRGEWDL